MEKIKDVVKRIGAFLLGIILLPFLVLTIIGTFPLALICVAGYGAKEVKSWWCELILPLVAIEIYCVTFTLVEIDV